MDHATYHWILLERVLPLNDMSVQHGSSPVPCESSVAALERRRERRLSEKVASDTDVARQPERLTSRASRMRPPLDRSPECSCSEGWCKKNGLCLLGS